MIVNKNIIVPISSIRYGIHLKSKAHGHPLTGNSHLLQDNHASLTDNTHLLTGNHASLTGNTHLLQNNSVFLKDNSHLLQDTTTSLTNNGHRRMNNDDRLFAYSSHFFFLLREWF